MFTLVPLVLAFVAIYGMHTTRQGMNPGWISFDTWVFFLLTFIGSVLALPMVLFHVRELSPMVGLILNCAGCGTILIGFVIFYVIPHLPCGEDDGLLRAYQYQTFPLNITERGLPSVCKWRGC
jgi:uncharacterized membrane protein